MEFFIPADLLQNVKGTLACLKGDFHRLQQPAILRYQIRLIRAAQIHMFQNGSAGNGDGAAVGRPGLRRFAPGQKYGCQHQCKQRPNGCLFVRFPDYHSNQLRMSCVARMYLKAGRTAGFQMHPKMQQAGLPPKGAVLYCKLGLCDQSITFSTNRWRIAATCALVASPFGMSLPEAPLIRPSETAQLSASLA